MFYIFCKKKMFYIFCKKPFFTFFCKKTPCLFLLFFSLLGNFCGGRPKTLIQLASKYRSLASNWALNSPGLKCQPPASVAHQLHQFFLGASERFVRPQKKTPRMCYSGLGVAHCLPRRGNLWHLSC